MSDSTSSNPEPETSEPESVMPGNEGVQLSRLSSVLNGLEQGASAMRRHVLQAMRAVRSGTYIVDPVQLSRRIVGETVGSARKLAGIGSRTAASEAGSAPLPGATSGI
ncbi:MAG: hypothetical protein JO097_13855 [Acidobacteriaceae bacterium]|nr:hypothetical protein [Acidobacteriaceae bacterium]MBV9294546.1 hypothetical protein [Acidobacteriaceae bacterium]MBV9765419.1 hypothetical protein [Acidobacteriaceae bacterium]